MSADPPDTKTCPHCAMVVPKAARICPHCRKRLGTHPLTMGCAVLFGLVVVIAVIGNLSSPTSKPSNVTPPTAEDEKTFKAKEAAAAAANKEADAKEAAFLKTPAGRICAKHAGWDRSTCEAIAKRQTIVGMTAEQVRLAWGKPDHVNSTITGNHRSEQWVYGSNQYVYFEDGIMTSLQQSK